MLRGAPTGPASPLGLRPAMLAWGALWGLLAMALFSAVLPPRPQSLAEASILVFLGLFLGLSHGGLLALAGGAIESTAWARRAPRLVTALVAVALSFPYALLGLSLAKYGTVGSHLRYEDFWFLARGVAQLGDETTRAERAFFTGAAVLPWALALLFFALARALRRFRLALAWRETTVLALAGLAGLAVLAWRYEAAERWLAVGLPETRWLFRSGTPVAASAGAGHGAPIVPYPATPDPARANVLFLMLESIPWDRLYGPGARPESTPRLVELARGAVVFDRAYATSTHSDYAQTSILASLYPRKYPEHDYFTRLDYPRTLFWDPLHALGYRTAIFSCQNERWGNMIAFNTTPGLDLFRHSPDWPDAPRRGEGAESKVYEPAPVAAFLEWLDREPGRPFAVYLNFQATHYPYMVPDDFRAPYEPSTIDFPTTFLSYPREKIPVMVNRFHNALAYVDLHVGKVIDGLAARGLLDDTVIVVVSDHGEAFYEHGMPTHGTMLLEEQARTAMLVVLPGEPARRVEESVSVLDAVPVVFRFLGLPRHGNFQGRDDVLEPGYDGAARPLPMTIQGMTREDGLLEGGWKLILNHDRRERALFFLGDDPGERVNRVVSDPERAAALERELGGILGPQLEYYRARGWEAGRYPPPLP